MLPDRWDSELPPRANPPLPPSQRPLSSGVPDVRERPRAAPDRMSEKRVEEAPAELSAKVRPPPAPPSRLAPARRARPTGRPLPAAPTARPTEGRARPSANGERGRGARGPARGIPLSEVGGGGGGGAARRGAEGGAERPAAPLRPLDPGERAGLRAALAVDKKAESRRNGSTKVAARRPEARRQPAAPLRREEAGGGSLGERGPSPGPGPPCPAPRGWPRGVPPAGLPCVVGRAGLPAVRRPRLPSASPAPSPLCLRPRVLSASFLAAERCHVFSHLAYRK